MTVERRPNSRIVRSALEEVQAIRTLMADSYQDAGDGRTLLRELVQNADDANAKRLVFTVVERGWDRAQNSLLKGPALIVTNDGPFSAKNHNALHKALGGSKATDPTKIGRFGIGLKSVFHICEALVYVGAEGGVQRPGALNPWAGTGEQGDADPLHPDWDSVENEDLSALLDVARVLLGTIFDDGFLLWIPLRRDCHLNRAEEGRHGLGQACPTTEDVAAWFAGPDSLALLLGQCAHLLSIDANRASAPQTLTERANLAGLDRPDFESCGWVGRYDDDTAVHERAFKGQIQDGRHVWSVTGIDTLGLDSLRQLRSGTDWPREFSWRDGRSVSVARKALAHAAITVLRRDGGSAEHCRIHLRWAVFLALDDNPSAGSSAVAESLGQGNDSSAWNIVLHGYFWPAHDRRSIPGVTSNDPMTGDNVWRDRWNRAVRDDLVLPLLPQALADACEGIPQRVAWQLLEAVASSVMVTTHHSSIIRRQVLLPLATEDGVRWQTHSNGVPALSIPSWTHAPRVVRQRFIMQIENRSDRFIFIDRDAPSIASETKQAWPIDWIESLLTCISADELKAREQLDWVTSVVSHLLRTQSGDDNERTSIVARWIAKRVSEGALRPTKKTKSAESRTQVREAWRRLLATLPNAWLVDAPVEAERAIVELAAEREPIVGGGLLPMPFGRGADEDSTDRPDPNRLDFALLALARLLKEGGQTSQRAQHSRLLLAETLLSVRGNLPVANELSRLQLFRVVRLPDDEEEACSIADLENRLDAHRVFAGRRTQVNDRSSPDAASDPKRAVRELAEGIGEDVWFVVDSAVAAATDVPIASVSTLASAIVAGEMIRSKPHERVKLLQRLAKRLEDEQDPCILRAIVSLLTGQIAGSQDQCGLFFVRRDDSEGQANRISLRILLQLLNRPQRAVVTELAEIVPSMLAEQLRLKAVDSGSLRGLLKECLEVPTYWSMLDREEVLHLLKHLHGAVYEDRDLWREMPLHRGDGHERAGFDGRASRVCGALRLPVELATEMRVLDPDPEIADLYHDVPLLDDDGILRAMLESGGPQDFVDRIVGAIYPNGDGNIMLPRNDELRSLLKSAAWLPHRDGNAGLAPNKLLILPSELQERLVPLAEAGALGDYRLTSDVSHPAWKAAKDIVHEVLGRPTPLSQVQHLGRVLDPTAVADVDGGTYALLPDTDSIDIPLICDALQSVLSDSHFGWAIVAAATRATQIGASRSLDEAGNGVQDAVLATARSLCATVSTSQQVEVLSIMARGRPARDSPGGRLFRRLVDVFTKTEGFHDQVLPFIKLPTQDGHWHRPHDIARSALGVARGHLVRSDLREPLRLDSDEPVRKAPAIQIGSEPLASIGIGTAEVLTRYFEPWHRRLPPASVGAFLSLLGNGRDDAVLNLSERWLGDDVSVEGIRLALGLEGRFKLKVVVYETVAHGEHLEVMNLLGEHVEMEAGTENSTIFAAEPIRKSSLLGDFWEISFRDVEPRRRNADDLLDLLGQTVEWWAVRTLGIDRQMIRSWWSQWGTGSQAQVGPVQASILAHLPLTLRQLDVRERIPVREALNAAERAQRKREQAPPAQRQDAIDNEQSTLDRLASLIRDVPENRRFIWERIRQLMQRYGYREDSVLLELAQNADDALCQAAEIVGGSLPQSARRLVVRVAEYDVPPTVDVIHYGRPINDTGGAAFPMGRDREWDQDLYFMMLLNLSGKPAEMPGQNSAASTTGRFGLGFKSVHLVSDSPSVVSGFVAFSIAGGLLPSEHPIQDDTSLPPVDGHPATRVRLPLLAVEDPSALIEKLFRRFSKTRALIPAFAREICEIVVEGGPDAGVSAFDGVSIENAPGWSVTKTSVRFPGGRQWRLLRYRPADAGRETGTAAVAIGLHGEIPEPFPPDLPFLWNVVPTSESWGHGYAVNGPFKLDPGRTHVSLDDTATLQVANALGEALGEGLLHLHDALVNGQGTAAHGLPTGKRAANFMTSLWKVLASGLASEDDSFRRRFLHCLHGPGRGISMWMNARSVVPTGLRAPFPPRLPPLPPDVTIEIASGGLASSALCAALVKIDDVASLTHAHLVVSDAVAIVLQPLLCTTFPQLRACDFLKELVNRWDHLLTPERLNSLRPLAEDSVWKAIASDPSGIPWHTGLRAQSAAGPDVSLRKLLLPPQLSEESAGAVPNSAAADEQRRAAFAPHEWILDPAYVVHPEGQAIFLRLRVHHNINAATMASWYKHLSADRRDAALSYLLDGELRNELLELLVPQHARPHWLDNYGRVREMLNKFGVDPWRVQALLAALFPDRFPSDTGPTPPFLPPTARGTFFKRLQDWWDEPSVRQRVVQVYEEKAWPEWLRQQDIKKCLDTDSDEHWLGLLVLGACQSIGLAGAGHHRRFLESVWSEDWWKVFMRPDDTSAWMTILRDWQDGTVSELKYVRWMSLFPTIYQLSRYLEKYRRLLRSAGHRPRELYRVQCLLAPRVDEALTGAGQNFDAPPAPLNMGLHWVLRELVRLRVITGTHLYRDCWVPSEQVLGFLRPLGLKSDDPAASNSDKARTVFEFLKSALKTETPNLHLAFDIPLRHIAEDTDLQRQLGLEN